MVGRADVLERLRAICLGLPETSERPSHGATSFVRGKTCFLMLLDDHHGDGRFATAWGNEPGQSTQAQPFQYASIRRGNRCASISSVAGSGARSCGTKSSKPASDPSER